MQQYIIQHLSNHLKQTCQTQRRFLELAKIRD